MGKVYEELKNHKKAHNLYREAKETLKNLIPHSGFNSPQLAANFKRIFKFDTPSACGGAVYFLNDPLSLSPLIHKYTNIKQT